MKTNDFSTEISVSKSAREVYDAITNPRATLRNRSTGEPFLLHPRKDAGGGICG